MGQVSFAIAQAARDLGARLATGVPVAEILPGEGVRLEGGELILAAVVVSNADPRRTLDLVDPAARGLAAHRAMVDMTRGLDAAQEAFADAGRGVPTSASARSTSRPPTIPRSPRPAGIWSACSPSTPRTTWPRATGRAAGPRSAG